MSYSTKIKVFIIGLVAVVVLGKVGCFYFDKQYDNYRRPWAFSSDSTKPLLVGKWQGSCTDPDQVVHKVEMEIFSPTTDEERWKRVSSRNVKRDRSSTTFFDGLAVLETQGKRDSCELWGGLDKADGQGLHFQFWPISDVHPPGFNLNLLNGKWKDDTIDLSVEFAWFRPDGSSHYDSADPRHEMKGKLLMTRIK